jgi:HK97 family phage major capsid protein
MARNDIDGTGWLVEDKDSNVVQAFAHSSAWEKAARPVPMTANTVRIPRIEDMDVDVIPKGGAYGEDQSGADTVAISAAKFGKALRIAEEDVADTQLAPYLEAKKVSAASSFAKKFDNAALGTTAAANGLTVPFTSLYRALTNADADTGYAANANVRSGAALTYDVLNDLIAVAEASDYYDESQVTAIAHPSFRTLLRGLKDGQNRPLFLTDIVGDRQIDRVLGLPILWSNGAKTSATAVTTNNAAGGAKGAAGNPLFAIVNRAYAVVGNRSPFESVTIPGRDGLAALTDEDILKVRVRKAAGVTMPQAHALFERTSA